jgi:hypothetical protein
MIPIAEFVQSSVVLEDLNARSEIEMIGITEDQIVTHVGYSIVIHAFDRTIGSHRHECRSYDIAMGKRDDSTTGIAPCILMS